MKRLSLFLLALLAILPSYSYSAIDVACDLNSTGDVLVLSQTPQDSVENSIQEVGATEYHDISTLFFDILYHPTDITLISNNITEIASNIFNMVTHMLDKKDMAFDESTIIANKQAIDTCMKSLDAPTRKRIALLIAKKIHEQKKTVVLKKEKDTQSNDTDDNDKNEKKKLLFINIAHMVNNLANILQDPHDKDNLVANVTNMFGHALTIAVHAGKK